MDHFKIKKFKKKFIIEVVESCFKNTKRLCNISVYSIGLLSKKHK